MTDPGRVGAWTPGKPSSLNRHANTQEVAKDKEELVQGKPVPGPHVLGGSQWWEKECSPPCAKDGRRGITCEPVLWRVSVSWRQGIRVSLRMAENEDSGTKTVTSAPGMQQAAPRGYPDA